MPRIHTFLGDGQTPWAHPALLWQAAHGFIILAHKECQCSNREPLQGTYLPQKKRTAARLQPAHIDFMPLQHFSCIAAVILLLLQTHATAAISANQHLQVTTQLLPLHLDGPTHPTWAPFPNHTFLCHG